VCGGCLVGDGRKFWRVGREVGRKWANVDVGVLYIMGLADRCPTGVELMSMWLGTAPCSPVGTWGVRALEPEKDM